MEPRSFRRIASLPPARRISFVSEGLTLLAENVGGLLEEARFCWPEAPRASAIAASVAAEEAAKAIMLVDYLRPTKGVHDARLSDHLGSVVDHGWRVPAGLHPLEVRGGRRARRGPCGMKAPFNLPQGLWGEVRA